MTQEKMINYHNEKNPFWRFCKTPTYFDPQHDLHKVSFFLYNNYNDHVLHHFEKRGEQVHTPGQFRILLLYFLHALLRVAALER